MKLQCALAISGAILLILAIGDSGPKLCAVEPDVAHGQLPANLELGKPSQLPRPSSMAVSDFEKLLFDFVNSRRYIELGWLRDKGVRDTGPFVNGKYFGTHPAVRVFYSPEVMQWLMEGRKSEIPDGAMIIKEQYLPPAARHDGLSEAQLWESLESWTIMVKDSQGSHDGWFWSNPAKNQQVVDYSKYPFEEPFSGFGLYCVRCHGATQSPGPVNEYTFSSLRNIQGFPGDPILFRVDDSWREVDELEDLSNEALLAGKIESPPAGLEIDPLIDKPPVDEVDSSPNSSPNSPAVGAPEMVGDAVLGELKVAGPVSAHPRCTAADNPTLCLPELNQAFVKLFSNIKTSDRSQLLHFPPVTRDSVPRSAHGTRENQADPGRVTVEDRQAFVTSNQCMSCHAGITEPFGPSMFIPLGESAGYGEPGLHISPFGEWRWTPMGLAGRDPIFYAQLESELALLKREFDAEQASSIGESLVQTCLGCHGVMGKRQHDLDNAGGSPESFAIHHVFAAENDPNHADFHDSTYGALARDGVSCVVCHRMQPRPQPAGDTREYLEHFLQTSITGNFYLGKPGEIYGPFKDDQIAPYVMEHSLALKPKHSSYIKESQMCGTCHTVNLPIIDWPSDQHGEIDDLIDAEPNPAFQKFHHHVEQATYLEWLNSEFENEFNKSNPQAKSCQDCHMSKSIVDADGSVRVAEIQSRIAAIQDDSYPDAEHLAPRSDLKVRYRTEGYSRHNFRGLNVFMIEMFNQFDDVLGVRKHDYMTGSKLDIQHAVDDFVKQATSDTASLTLSSRIAADNKLLAKVEIHNHAGHRFPSGVGFRRAFIELLVRDESRPPEDQIIWSSGRTNEIGLILDHFGQPLPTELFDKSVDGSQQFQPHHEVISSSSQVQIYETLLANRKGEFTTSFIHGCTVVKDNRFLPRGWSRQGPGPALKGNFLRATYPGPVAGLDPRYQDGSGSDETLYSIPLPEGVNRQHLLVEATLYYQAIPPYFLKNIFDLAPDGPAAQRLHYICANLKHEGTAIENWKLRVVSSNSKPTTE